MVQEIVYILSTAAAHLEGPACSNAVIIPNFPHSIELDHYSCGAKSVCTILKYFGRNVSPELVERQLQTNWEGAGIGDTKRVLRQHGLRYRKTRELKSAIDAGCPVLISTHGHWHYSVVYGYSSSHYFVMNLSLGEMGWISCAVRKKKFKRIFDGGALEVYSNLTLHSKKPYLNHE